MNNGNSKIDYHKFVEEELTQNGLKFFLADEKFVTSRLTEVNEFVNGILREYVDIYKWVFVDDKFLLNPMVDKWKYSHAILNNKNEICFLNFTSVYTGALHQHFVFTSKEERSKNLGKLNMIKLCQKGIDDGMTHMTTYVPKKNNRSLIYHMKMGWEIVNIRDNVEILMNAELLKVRNLAYDIIISGK